MKIALINDNHIGARQESLHFNNYFMKFFDDVFFPYIKKHNIDHVFQLGDFVDRRKFMNYVIANSCRKRILDKLPNSHFLVGNHDVPYRNTNNPNAIAELIEGRYYFNIYTSPKEIDLDGLLVGIVPWINSSNYQESLDFIKNTKAKVLFGHFEISGFEMDKGNVCYSGLDRKLFDRFDKVISGHFHTKSTDGAIFYLGTQYDITWSDYGDQKGFHVFDTKTLDLTFVPNPNKMFHKVWYDDSTQNLDYWTSQNLSQYKDNYLKVIVTTKNNPFLFDKIIEMIYEENPIEIIISEDYGTIYEDSEQLVNESEDTPTIMSKYIDGLILPESISIDKIKKVVRELHIEALGMESQ
jgi:Straboviridae/Ackermannviridae/Kyanoviridae exonuclease subunit 1